MGSFPGLRRFSGGRNSNLLQCSLLENHMDSGAWKGTVHRVTYSWTRLKQVSKHTHTRVVYTIYIYSMHVAYTIKYSIYTITIYWCIHQWREHYLGAFRNAESQPNFRSTEV